MPAIIDVRYSLGAILIGCFIAVALSGIVAFQACLYFRMYPQDKPLNKLMVAVVWMLDIAHSFVICTSAWIYLIANFGNVEAHVEGVVPETVAVSIGITAFITLITHAYFLHRLLHLSKNRFLVGFTWLLVIGRITCGLTTTVTLAHYKNFPKFTAHYENVFTLGLTFSSAADVAITFGMCYYLQENRRGLGTMDDVIDSIIIYTINNGTLTCISTIVSLICWLVMRKNLIFMALHFAIAKMYANSLFGTLNMRRNFRGRAHPPKEPVNHMPVLFPDSFNRNNRGAQLPGETFEFTDAIETKGLQITVEKTVQCDERLESGPSSLQNSPSSFEEKSRLGIMSMTGTVV